MFREDTVRAAFERIEPSLAAVGDGQAVPIPSADDEAGALLVELAMDGRPVSEPGVLLHRLQTHEIDERIAALRERLAGLDPEDETYSTVFGDLLGLQRAKREHEPG